MNNKGSDDMACGMCGEVSISYDGVIVLSWSHRYSLTPYVKILQLVETLVETLKIWLSINSS